MKSLVTRLLAALTFMGMVTAASHADTYPEKGRQLTIIAPFPAGGGTDILARLLAQRLTQTWGVTAVVENKPGADTIIGMSQLARAKPDGYTVGFATAEFVINHASQIQLPYDSVKDFTPVALLAKSPMLLLVNSNSPAKSLADLAAASKAKQLSYGSCCAIARVATERFNAAAGVNGLEVPYKGASPALLGLVAGETDYVLESPVSSRAHIESGKLRVLAATTRERVPAYPNVPTLIELGVPNNFELFGWWSIVMPAGTDPAIVAKMNAAARDFLDTPEARHRFGDWSLQATHSSPEGLATFLQTEYARYSTVLTPAGKKRAEK